MQESVAEVGAISPPLTGPTPASVPGEEYISEPTSGPNADATATNRGLAPPAHHLHRAGRQQHPALGCRARPGASRCPDHPCSTRHWHRAQQREPQPWAVQDTLNSSDDTSCSGSATQTQPSCSILQGFCASPMLPQSA